MAYIKNICWNTKCEYWIDQEFYTGNPGSNCSKYRPLVSCSDFKVNRRDCEGDCTPHVGKVQHVYSGKSPKTGERWDWWYCQEAIKEDKLRGFEVVDVKTGKIL